MADKVVKTSEWLQHLQEETVAALKLTNIDLQTDDFFSVVALPDSMVGVVQVETDENDHRKVNVKVVPGIVLPAENVHLDVFESSEDTEPDK